MVTDGFSAAGHATGPCSYLSRRGREDRASQGVTSSLGLHLLKVLQFPSQDLSVGPVVQTQESVGYILPLDPNREKCAKSPSSLVCLKRCMTPTSGPGNLE